MGLASFLVWKNGERLLRKIALGLYLISIALNWAWTPVFFVLNHVKDAFAIIIVQHGFWKWFLSKFPVFWNFLKVLFLFDVVVLSIILVNFKISKWASALNVPYLIWISFASALNYDIWKNNGDVPEPNPWKSCTAFEKFFCLMNEVKDHKKYNQDYE